MKSLHNKLFYFLLVFGFLQSCAVYHKKHSTLDQVIYEEKPVKIETINNEILKYQKVIKVNNDYFGLVKKYNPNNRIQLKESEIKSIRLRDSTDSIGGSILTGVTVLAGILAIILITSF